jgi:hypothetical protein
MLRGGIRKAAEHKKCSRSAVLRLPIRDRGVPLMSDCEHNTNKKRSFPGHGEWYVESEISEAPERGAKNGGSVRPHDDECN